MSVDLEPPMSSANPDWETPGSFLDLVRQMGPIMLDPCTTPANPVGADRFFCPQLLDGLTEAWQNPRAAGLVFCNPPYGRGLGAWSAKMHDEAEKGAEIIGLLPARTDTKWFQAVTTADAICFWRGRIKFKGAPNAAPFPSVVPYWGDRADEFRRIFSPHGWIV